MIDRACVSLNNNCNLKCRYCHFQDKQKDYSAFCLDDLKTIATNIHNYCIKKEIGTFKLGIVGSGEPMLKVEVILGFLDFLEGKDFREFSLYTITNGTLLTEDLLKKFYEYKDIIKICVSLDGYEELHNLGRSLYEKTMKGITNYKKVFGHNPSINATINIESYKNKEKLIDFYKSNGMVDVTFSKLIGYFNDDLYISDEQYCEFLSFAKQNGMKSRQFRQEKCYDCTMYGKLCGVGRTNIFITPEGIFPCGRFYKNEKYFLGAFDSSIFDIETKINKMNPVEDGKCYYIENVEGK